MSRRFRIISWIVAISDMLIGSVFYTAHEAMVTPAWHFVFIFLPWEFWALSFMTVGLGMAMAIGTGISRFVRKVACFSVVLLMVWAADFALVIPAIIGGASISWLGIVLVSTIAAIELWYLGLPASTWLDQVEGDHEESLVGL